MWSLLEPTLVTLEDGITAIRAVSRGLAAEIMRRAAGVVARTPAKTATAAATRISDLRERSGRPTDFQPVSAAGSRTPPVGRGKTGFVGNSRGTLPVTGLGE